MNIQEMILKEFCNLIEKRSHPELNIKESSYEQIKKYLDSGKEYYISFTEIDKIGINPSSKYNTPIGIYTYPLQEIYEYFKLTGSDWDKKKDIHVPFPPKESWNFIYILEKKSDGKYVDLADYSSKDYDNDREKLIGLWGEQVIRNAEKSMYEKAKHKSPGGYFWYITYFLVYQYVENRHIKWNELLRKTLGYDGITDKSGLGIIHPAEPIQAVFFSINSFNVVDKIKYSKYNRLEKVIRKSIVDNDINTIKSLLNQNVDFSMNNNYAIKWASENGHFEVVKLLLQDKRVDPSTWDNYAIKWASENGHFEVVKLLLQDKRVDPSADNNQAIRWASRNGHLEVVKLLLQDKRVDPSTWDNYAIKWASENGHFEVVKLLFQHPKVQETLTDEQKEEYEKQIGK